MPEELPRNSEEQLRVKPSAYRFLAIVAAGTVGGGTWGVIYGADSERSSNQHDIEIANDAIECGQTVSRLSDGNRSVVVRLGQLSFKEQKACGFDFSYGKSITKRDSATKGSKIVKVNYDNTTVKLPKITYLSQRANEHRESSKDFSHLPEIGFGAYGTFMGFMVSVLGASGLDKIAEHRRNSALQRRKGVAA